MTAYTFSINQHTTCALSFIPFISNITYSTLLPFAFFFNKREFLHRKGSIKTLSRLTYYTRLSLCPSATSILLSALVTMTSRPEFSNELISRLTFSPELDLGGMIRHLSSPKPSTIPRDSGSSAIGRLDLLPEELLLEVLNLLDFQCLSRVSCVSIKGKRVIEALRSYRDVMKYSPTILAALGRIQLLQFHSATLLR